MLFMFTSLRLIDIKRRGHSSPGGLNSTRQKTITISLYSGTLVSAVVPARKRSAL